MPSPPQKPATQEAASLTGEGLMPELGGLIEGECSESLQAKYLINDSQQTHIKDTQAHTHTNKSPLVHIKLN